MKPVIAILALVVYLASPAYGVTWSSCTVFTNSSSTEWVGDIMARHHIAAILETAHRVGKSKTPFRKHEVLKRAWGFKNLRQQPNVNDLSAQCTKVNVTLDRSRGGETIQFFVKRIFYGQNPTSCTKQIWLNQGGPGGTGVAMERIAPELARTFQDACIYIPDHRGTGRSTYVDCEITETLTQCQNRIAQQYGVFGATSFNTREAATDISEFMQMMSTEENQNQIHLYGVSYGTYLVNRFLQLFPTQTDTNIIDGVVDPPTGFLNEPLERLDPPGRQLFSQCAADSFCASKLGNDPAGFALQVYNKLDQNHCSILGLDGTSLKQVLTAFGVYQLYPFVTAWLYRINRCEDADATALVTMANWLNSQLVSSDDPAIKDSNYIFNLIGINELFNASNTPAILAQQERNAVFWATYGELMYESAADWTLTYTEPLKELRVGSSVTGDLLILNGKLDFQTPVSWPRTYSANSLVTNKAYYEVDNTGHGTAFGGIINNSPTSQTCGMNLILSLIQNQALPTSAPCATNTRPIDFIGESLVTLIDNPNLPDMYENNAGNNLVATIFLVSFAILTCL